MLAQRSLTDARQKLVTGYLSASPEAVELFNAWDSLGKVSTLVMWIGAMRKGKESG